MIGPVVQDPAFIIKDINSFFACQLLVIQGLQVQQDREGISPPKSGQFPEFLIQESFLLVQGLFKLPDILPGI
jgi:hypothetical protein